jgi:hypothetical protein
MALSMSQPYGDFSLDRLVDAPLRVHARMIRACRALETAKVPYALTGGNAVTLWVGTVDGSAVRNTNDVDILIQDADLVRVRAALRSAGILPHLRDRLAFCEAEDNRARVAVRLHLGPLDDSTVVIDGLNVLSVQALVEALCRRFDAESRMLLLDLAEVELLSELRISGGLAQRLQSLLDDPNG